MEVWFEKYAKTENPNIETISRFFPSKKILELSIKYNLYEVLVEQMREVERNIEGDEFDFEDVDDIVGKNIVKYNNVEMAKKFPSYCARFVAKCGKYNSWQVYDYLKGFVSYNHTKFWKLFPNISYERFRELLPKLSEDVLAANSREIDKYLLSNSNTKIIRLYYKNHKISPSGMATLCLFDEYKTLKSVLDSDIDISEYFGGDDLTFYMFQGNCPFILCSSEYGSGVLQTISNAAGDIDFIQEMLEILIKNPFVSVEDLQNAYVNIGESDIELSFRKSLEEIILQSLEEYPTDEHRQHFAIQQEIKQLEREYNKIPESLDLSEGSFALDITKNHLRRMIDNLKIKDRNLAKLPR